DWPGNVRELENAAEKWTVLRRLLDEAVASQLVADSLAPAGERSLPGGANPFAGTLDEIEQRAVRAAVEAESGNISRAARRLGVDRQTLRRKLDARE
ncbi:MAG: helix-turn-helix domain-containing protein, partial [Spirochaetaceae bacterium]|nr:helix-turn-helix domain-containing protein [Spirochaetaceae bacterium]